MMNVLTVAKPSPTVAVGLITPWVTTICSFDLEKKRKTRPLELRGFQLKGVHILISWVKDYLVRG
jgi:hypothetical protein